MEIEVKGKRMFVRAIEAYKWSRCIRVAKSIVGGKEPGIHLKEAE